MAITPGELLLYVCSYFSLFTAIFFFITFFEDKKKLRNPKLQYFPSVSVIVPAYNEEKTITKTIQSLLKLDYPKGKLEIIVVDDGSKDSTYSSAKQFVPFGVKVFTKANSGKGDSLNFGLARISGEFVACLDADSIVERGCLKKMLGYFEDSQVMAVTPSMKIFSPTGLLQRIQAIEYLLGVYLRKVFSYLGSIHVTPGPFTIFRKSFFDLYGGYDTHNLTEDIEIALRIQSHKFHIENSMDANVWTIGPNTFSSLLRQRLRWYIGFLDNIQEYKHLFSRKYGNLGVFFLPGVFVSTALVIALLFYLVYKTLTRFYTEFLDLLAINFDIWPLLKLEFKPFFLNVDPLMVLSIISLTIATMIIYLARKYSKEQSRWTFSYFLYLVLYLPLYAFWWLLSSGYKLSGKSIAWGRKGE